MQITCEELAWRIRRHAIDMVHHAHASHIGGILSIADIVAVLYHDIAKVDPNYPKASERDRIILSKGHTGVAIYAALAEMGFFPVSNLETYGENGSSFSCHVSHKGVNGIEFSTGSLGHGIGVACGIAIHAKRRMLNYHTYVILGDGECNEGAIWEAVMLAAQEQLSNLTAIVDCNGIQGMGKCRDIIKMQPMKDKWKSFGWNTVTVNGHDCNALRSAFSLESKDKPKVILAEVE